MAQMSLFGPAGEGEPKPASDAPVRHRIIVTVKAAPNPSGTHGETVCVAGVSARIDSPGWFRLYPINFRELEPAASFAKYDVIEVDAVPARQDQRRESWRPRMHTLRVVDQLPPWRRRQEWLDSYLEDSMCQLNWAAQRRSDAPSLALVRPREVLGLRITPHPGWTADEQRKIDEYVNQLDLFTEVPTRQPLQAPRFRAAYRYRCHESGCNTHEQGLLDWEFVALQRRLTAYSDEDARRQLENRFLTTM